jgi:hypothetical protein
MLEKRSLHIHGTHGTGSAKGRAKDSTMISLLSNSPQALAAIASAAPEFVTTLVTAVAIITVFFALFNTGEPEDPTEL